MVLGTGSTLVASAAAATAASEYLLRSYLPRSSLHYPWIPNSRVSFTLDPDQYPGFDLAGEFRINSIGERGSTLAPRSSPKPLRILVMGGSAAECPAFSDEYFWPLVLQEELKREGGAFRAGYSSINVGSIGRSLSPVQLQKEALDLICGRYRNIDFVITFFGASDVLQWMEQGCDLSRFKNSMHLKSFFRANCLPPFGLNPAQSALGKLSKQLARKLISQPVTSLSMGANLRKLRERRRAATEILSDAPGLGEFYELFRQCFLEFITTLSLICPKIIVVEQPWMCREIRPDEEPMMWHFAFGDPRKSERGPYFGHNYTSSIMHQISDIQREVALARGVPFISLIDKLPSNLDYYADYFHQTPKGSVEIGRVLAREFSSLVKSK